MHPGINEKNTNSINYLPKFVRVIEMFDTRMGWKLSFEFKTLQRNKLSQQRFNKKCLIIGSILIFY